MHRLSLVALFGMMEACASFIAMPTPRMAAAAMVRSRSPVFIATTIDESTIYDAEFEAKRQELEAKLVAADAAKAEAEEKSALATSEQARLKMVAAEWRERLRTEVTNLAKAMARADTAEAELDRIKEKARKDRETRMKTSARLKDQIVQLVAANKELTQSVEDLKAQLDEQKSSKKNKDGKPQISARTVEEMASMLESLRALAIDSEESEVDGEAAEKAAEQEAAAKRAAAQAEAAQRAEAQLAAEEKEAAEREEKLEAERLASVAAAMRTKLAAKRALAEKEAEAKAAEARALAATKAANERASAEKAALNEAADKAMKDTMKTEQAAKAAPVPDAPAFPVGTMEYFEAEAANVNGRDPRHAPPWITENSVLLKELADNSTPQPKAATASSLDAIVNIQHLEQLEDAITSASSKERLVVVKFYAPWCRTCFQVKSLFEKLARGMSDAPVDFLEVDAGASRVLCALANIEKLPVVHVYREGELVDRMPIHKRDLVDACASGIEGHMRGLKASR